jgi:multidrug resistance efflux pump
MTTDSAKDWDPADRPSATPAGAPVGQHEEPARRQNARSLQFALERQLQIDAGLAKAAKAPERKPDPKPAENASTIARRLVKVALGLGLAVTLGWSPLRALMTTTSIEALINARVETIRSPIEGTVEAAPDADRDWTSGDAPPRLRVVDSLADHARLDDLKRQYDALETQSRGLQRKSELVSVELEALNVQIEGFRQGRLKLLDARVAAQTAELEALVAKSSQAAAAKQRTEHLRQSGVATAAEGDRVRYEWVAATSAEAAAARRLEETRVERDAIAQGVFIGDSYNDSPSSDQRAAELRLRLGELEAERAAAGSQMKLLAGQIAEEEARYRDRSDALVVLPSSGRVWEMLTGPGEHVSKGQDLLRVLDCSHPMVSANVDESVYNRLEVGGSATFRPSQGGGKTYEGTIVNLTGAAGASANFAIPPVAMRKSPFYVTITVNDMKEGGCSVGRTGTVTFEASNDVSRNQNEAGSISRRAQEEIPALRPELL